MPESRGSPKTGHGRVHRSSEARSASTASATKWRNSGAPSRRTAGDRIERLAADIRRLEGEREARARKAERYAELARAVDESPAASDAAFLDQRTRLADQAEALRSNEARLQNDLTELGVDLRQGKQEHDAFAAEIESLKARRSNIPADQIAMRAALCRALDLDEANMPFAGELLQVREEERDWEGAAERLLRSFGLSLLVPDESLRAGRGMGGCEAPRGPARLLPGPHAAAGRAAGAASRLPGAEALGEAGLGVLRVAGARARPPFRRGVLRDG